ncbi:Phage-related baseplate assembly protein [Cohnella sp. OV330]|uniref:baseplate assembly protein n=1 Tax=Cohnella sp. OV330 TaxID=1855288 RepID=UPI0008F28CE0|nr:baseplate J/gp47 family protein [Cohnella sp. OV330]SFA91425.1 Phage-related baseplate assembly protein [Cohnella sp. OV330]
MQLIDLPEVEYVSEDVASTLNNMVTVMEGLLGRKLYPGDPVRLFLLGQAALQVQLMTAINQTARLNLLRYARGPVLDNIGAFTETPRLSAAAASTTVRVTLSAAQPTAVTIPAGTRVSTASDPKAYFATSTSATIAAGTLYVDVVAVNLTTGAAGNGYLPGQINQIVDPLPFVLSIVNTMTSSGGADIESDDAYRERIHEAPESFSVAGPFGAYEYWAKTANPAIVDVSVTSPSAMQVLVVPLLAGGAIPSQGVLDSVSAILSNSKVRPLTDQVTVAAPTTVGYNVTLTYYIKTGDSAAASDIQAAVNATIAGYVTWQKSKLGRDINPSELIRRVMMAGAYRVNVTSPVYTVVDPTKVAVAGTITATYGGTVND